MEDNKLNTIKAPHILLPKKDIDMSKWAVIACDQYTSQPTYWEDLKRYVGDSPSSFHLIYPEVYLDQDNDQYIKKINQAMAKYLNENILNDLGSCMILVDRKTAYAERRLGLVLAVDLEDYSYEVGSKALIRASEQTIISRIPPRAKIRKDATVEFPHTLLLINDPKKGIIESIHQQKDQFEKVYDFELNMDGGHLKGYKILDTDPIIKQLYGLIENQNDPVLFIAGDGNHSLATAKAHWEEVKKQTKDLSHPARYALVEVINIYDDGLTFEPIHRVIINADKSFLDGLLPQLKHKSNAWYIDQNGAKQPLSNGKDAIETYEIIEGYIDKYLKQHPNVAVDYIHGEDDLIEVCKNQKGSIGLFMPTISRKEIFECVEKGKVLPKKSFSMGEASEKRYYLESRKIVY